VQGGYDKVFAKTPFASPAGDARGVCFCAVSVLFETLSDSTTKDYYCRSRFLGGSNVSGYNGSFHEGSTKVAKVARAECLQCSLPSCSLRDLVQSSNGPGRFAGVMVNQDPPNRLIFFSTACRRFRFSVSRA
jgi:hypothetical protein